MEKAGHFGANVNAIHKQALRPGLAGVDKDSAIKDEVQDLAHQRPQRRHHDVLDSKKHVKFAENGGVF